MHTDMAKSGSPLDTDESSVRRRSAWDDDYPAEEASVTSSVYEVGARFGLIRPAADCLTQHRKRLPSLPAGW